MHHEVIPRIFLSKFQKHLKPHLLFLRKESKHESYLQGTGTRELVDWVGVMVIGRLHICFYGNKTICHVIITGREMKEREQDFS